MPKPRLTWCESTVHLASQRSLCWLCPTARCPALPPLRDGQSSPPQRDGQPLSLSPTENHSRSSKALEVVRAGTKTKPSAEQSGTSGPNGPGRAGGRTAAASQFQSPKGNRAGLPVPGLQGRHVYKPWGSSIPLTRVGSAGPVAPRPPRGAQSPVTWSRPGRPAAADPTRELSSQDPTSDGGWGAVPEE